MYLVITAQACASEPTKTCMIARKKSQQLEKIKKKIYTFFAWKKKVVLTKFLLLLELHF
jgi:hypothetical protein